MLEKHIATKDATQQQHLSRWLSACVHEIDVKKTSWKVNEPVIKTDSVFELTTDGERARERIRNGNY